MNGQLLHVGHKGLSLSKGSVPTLCPPWGAIPGSAPAARAQGSGLAARAACSRYSHSHHKLWMDTGYLILHPRGQSPFIKKCHSAAPIHKRRWWHFQSRTNPQCHDACGKEDVFQGCISSVGKQWETVFAECEWVHVQHRAELDGSRGVGDV